MIVLRFLIFITVPVLGLGCVSQDAPHSAEPLRTFSSENLLSQNSAPQCKAMLDNYCNFLYSPDVRGNLQFNRSPDSLKVLQGETRNQFTQVFFRYSQAKLQNRKALPKDFVSILERHSYFEKLRVFLDRTPRALMSLEQRLLSEQMDYELGYIWSTALNEAVVVRTNNKFPGSFKLPDNLVPLELQLEKRRIKRKLISEISQGLWRNDRNWKKVENGFLRLQDSYLRLISKMDIPDEVRKDWSDRIVEIRLVLPGAIPAISNEECSSTTANAFYYTYLNVLTVCAGDFNSEDIIQTLAHEIGHALGLDRSQYLFATQSDFGIHLANFRQDVCEPKQFSCSNWQTFKSRFAAHLKTLDGFEPELPKFHSCTKRRPTSESLSTKDIERMARLITADRISDLASSDRFLRITKPELPTPNGKLQKNPNYLNPCSYYLWSEGEEPVDDEITTLMFFTAEYRCAEDSDPQKMRSAIEVAKSMTEQILVKTLKIEGEFSGRPLLEREGYSSPPFERAADIFGSYAMAQMLFDEPSRQERRNKFLASSSWQCREPSLASHFPEESFVESEYAFNPYLENEQRKKEWFTEPLRAALACEQDFEFAECPLPLKSPLDSPARTRASTPN